MVVMDDSINLIEISRDFKEIFGWNQYIGLPTNLNGIVIRFCLNQYTLWIKCLFW